MSNIPEQPSEEATRNHQDPSLDMTLRPSSWNEYIGQDHLKKNLRILLDAAKKRKEPVEHILLSGPAGLGKTSMAHLIARDMNTNIRVTSGPAIERVGDLASILTNLTPYDILFIDEAHRLNKLIEEVLYPAMESRTIDIVIGKGPSARTIQIELPPFTLIAATTRVGLLSGPLRSRFGTSFRLEFYSQPDIEAILKRSAHILKLGINETAVATIARAARFTPRVANRLLKRARDYSQVESIAVINRDVAKKTLEFLEIDELGLEPQDRRLLEAIIKKFKGGPVGINTLAAALNDDKGNVEDIYEPYLMSIGLLNRTTAGRVATEAAYKHLGFTPPASTLL